MRAAAFFLLFSACTGKTNTFPDVPLPPPQFPPSLDTGWPPGNLGNIHVAHNVNRGTTEVYGVFARSSPAFSNLAQCGVERSLCFGGFPSDEDEFEDIDPDLDIEREDLTTQFAGFEITLGPYTLPYREDPDTAFGYYYLNATAQPLVEGWIGPSWSGQLEPYVGEEDLWVSKPLELQRPAVNGHVPFTNNTFVPFEWVPTGEGTLTLSVFTRFTLARVYHLEDDGYFALEADSLGLTNDTEDLTFVFTRWNQSTITAFGHVVDLVATSDAIVTGQYIQIGDREQIQIADECAESEGRPPLEAGGYWGYLGGQLNNDLDPFTCIVFPGDARGNDGFIPLYIEPRHSVTIDYNLFDLSASAYLMTDCSSTTFCFDGADESQDPNVHEFLSYFNGSNVAETIYLVLDATETGGSIYTVDITNDELFAPDMYDTCAQAQVATPSFGAGNYYADFVGYLDNINPGVGGCTGTSLPGADSLTPITLLSGETLTLNIEMPGGDPAIYLLYNCIDAFSCPVGADISTNETEQLVYQNNGLGTENLFVVVDSKTGLRPYFMGVSIF